jgi:hypothetical protein
MLRLELAQSRVDGLEFEAAWTLAVNRVTRDQEGF